MRIMNTKVHLRTKAAQSHDSAGDPELERYLVENHDDVAARLGEAWTSIARGDVAPLETLDVLLRDARRLRKARR